MIDASCWRHDAPCTILWDNRELWLISLVVRLIGCIIEFTTVACSEVGVDDNTGDLNRASVE